MSAILILLATISTRAQFYTKGSDPACLKWYSTETPYYKIIYPRGADSLARAYGRLLEQFREPTGHSLGITPSDGQRSKMPVVLHTHNMYSNGSVAWAPRRMDLFTIPEAYGSDPAPWDIQLVSHEPRHQAQLQYGYEGWLKYGTWLFGEGFNPVLWALYLDGPLGEGDAVAAETGLAAGTRARTSDFLSYFRVAYDQGDFRTWNRWRYGSFKYYVPDYYKIGYMTVAGERVFGDNPMALRKLFDHNLKAPWAIAPYNFKARKNFRKYAEKFNEIWQEDLAERAPFMPRERLSGKEAFPVFYSSLAALGGNLYAVRSGFTHNAELGLFAGGSFYPIRSFSGHASSLFPDEALGRLYWTETIDHPRWDLDGKSIIRYFDVDTQTFHDLTTSGRLYNPSPSEDGSRLVAVEYPVDGGSAIVVVSAADGNIQERVPAPEGVQATSAAFLDDDIYAFGLSLGGYGLYRIRGGVWSPVFGPVLAKYEDLAAHGSALEWTADNSGEKELYRYDVSSGTLEQVTSSRHGGEEYNELDGFLYFVATELDGKHVMRTPLDALAHRSAAVNTVHTYKVEDALTAQEDAMGGVDLNAPVEFTAPVRYNKLLHPLKFHTWLPLYVNYDAIANDSFDFSYDNIAAGLTAFFQNDLGTVSGSLGYSLHKDPDNEDRWRNALHAKLTYTGILPVFEASLDLGDRAAKQYRLGRYEVLGTESVSTLGAQRDVPFFTASVKTYIPLSFNKGGLLYGFTPQIRYSVSNNLYDTAPAYFKAPPGIFKGLPAHYGFVGFGEGKNMVLQNVAASVRGYYMLSRPKNRVYPRLGIGAEAGIQARPGLTDLFAPNIYGYAYGYLPGFYQTHGIKLTAMYQKELRDQDTVFGDVTVNAAPRGFSSSVAYSIATDCPVSWKVTADYAIPFTIGGDLSLMPVCYIRNFVLTPHADFAGLPDGNLWSVGSDLAADLGYILLAAIDAKLGVSFSFLGGTWFSASGQKDTYYIGPVFSMSF